MHEEASPHGHHGAGAGKGEPGTRHAAHRRRGLPRVHQALGLLPSISQNWVWWCTPVILTLERQQLDQKVQGHPQRAGGSPEIEDTFSQKKKNRLIFKS